MGGQFREEKTPSDIFCKYGKFSKKEAADIIDKLGMTDDNGAIFEIAECSTCLAANVEEDYKGWGWTNEFKDRVCKLLHHEGWDMSDYRECNPFVVDLTPLHQRSRKVMI